MAKAEYIWLSNDACLFRDKTHRCVEARRNATFNLDVTLRLTST
jgi:hypothetical protein